MASLSVPSSLYPTIKSAKDAARSSDTISIGAGQFDITSTSDGSTPGGALPTFAQLNAGVENVTYSGAGREGVGGTFIHMTNLPSSQNGRIYTGQLDRSGGVPRGLTLKQMTLVFKDGFGYILQSGDKQYLQNGDVFTDGSTLTGATFENVGFTGNSQGGFNGNYIDMVAGIASGVPQALSLTLDGVNATLTGQSGFNAGNLANTGGSSFGLLQGQGITIRNSSFDTAGFRNAFSFWASTDLLIFNNVFRRSANPGVRSVGTLEIYNSGATIIANRFSDGEYVDLYELGSRPVAVGGTGNFSGISRANTFDLVNGGYGIRLSSETSLQNLSVVNNIFRGGSPIFNLTATPFTAVFSTSGSRNRIANPRSTSGGLIRYNLYAGGTADDTITGSASSDYIDAGKGANSLTGGGSADAFVFQDVRDSAVDIVTDFRAAGQADLIWLENAGTDLQGTNGGIGRLLASQFVSNASGTATTTDQRILYNQTTGALLFDPDGSGTANPIQFATIQGLGVGGGALPAAGLGVSFFNVF